MHYSFSSVYMAIITSNLVLILLVLCFRNKKIMASAGYRLLLLFLGCSFVRFLFPIEMPFSKNILMPESISAVVSWVPHTLFTVNGFRISIWTFLHIVWFVGFIIQLVRYIILCKKTDYNILSSSLDVSDTEPYKTVLDEVCQLNNKENCFQILEVAGIQTPMLYGISSPAILVPENWNISRQDLYLAFSHEILHHYNHDLVIIQLVNILAVIYWWNPFCRILVKQTGEILEMRVDYNITGTSRHTIIAYTNCLLAIEEQIDRTLPCPVSDSLSISFTKMNESELKDRFHMMTLDIGRIKYFIKIALAVLVFGLFISSYLYTFESHYISPEHEETTIDPLSSGDTFAIQKEDDTYDIFYGDIFVENVDSLDYYPGIPIYTEEKEQ